MPRRKRDRWHQVANWLRHEFPAPHPVDLRVENLTLPRKPIEYGEAGKVGRRFLVRLDPRQTWLNGLDTLLHEWAHVLSWQAQLHHGDEWALAYGRLYRAWHEEDGWKESKEYGW